MILEEREERFESGSIYTLNQKRCFFCGQSFDADEPGIQWDGKTAVIFLHRGCALALTVQLCRDIHQLDVPSAKPEAYRHQYESSIWKERRRQSLQEHMTEE
jgi:hypothetical protein